VNLEKILSGNRSTQIDLADDRSLRAVWVNLRYAGRPCFSMQLLQEVHAAQQLIRQTALAGYEHDRDNRLLFQVTASADARVFNLGGDLPYFIELIEAGDREGLRRYARSCIDIQYASITHYGIPFTTIALVQGEALGGGFEAALSNTLLVAERGARFGFPEITFGMFPGMGALSLLMRKITPSAARRLMMDNRIYTGEELYELGVVDVLAPDGGGREAVRDYMRRHVALAPGLHGFQAAVDRCLPVSYEELADVVDQWVESALQLSSRNRRLMAYFARAQERRFGAGTDGAKLRDDTTGLNTG